MSSQSLQTCCTGGVLLTITATHHAFSVCLVQQGDVEYENAVPALAGMLLKPLPPFAVHQWMHQTLQLLQSSLNRKVQAYHISG